MKEAPRTGFFGLARIVAATRYSLRGLGAAWRHEAAFRQELVVVALLVPVAFRMARSAGELVLLLGTLVLVLITELLNSAIEALADAVSLERHPLLGRAKDLGSAAVMLAIGVAAGAWLAIAWTR
jgi:diacylglycerol kinase (ATP)